LASILKYIPPLRQRQLARDKADAAQKIWRWYKIQKTIQLQLESERTRLFQDISQPASGEPLLAIAAPSHSNHHFRTTISHHSHSAFHCRVSALVHRLESAGSQQFTVP